LSVNSPINKEIIILGKFMRLIGQYFAVFAFIFFGHVVHAQDGFWKPYKDDLFTPKVITSGLDCNATVYDYDEINDVNGQDCALENGGQKPVAQPNRITDLSLKRRERKDISGVVATWEVGPSPDDKSNPPRCAIIWCHGGVESSEPHHLGARDTNFGGNNNRLANLAIQQNCVYYDVGPIFGAFKTSWLILVSYTSLRVSLQTPLASAYPAAC